MIGTVKADGSLVLELYFDYISRDEYKVELEPRGGIINKNEFINKYIYGIPQALPLDVRRNTDEFQGWYKDLLVWKDGRHYAIKAGERGDRKYFAKWPELEFKGLRVATNKYVIGNTINPEGYSFGDTTEYKEGDKYISRVTPYIKDYQEGTTLATFVNNLIITDENRLTLTDGYEVKVLDLNGNALSENDLVGTGMKLVVTKDSDRVELTIVVIGDLDGDGKVAPSDVSEVRSYMALDRESESFTEEQRVIRNMAADVNFNGIPASHSEIVDVTAMRLSTTGYQRLVNH